MINLKKIFLKYKYNFILIIILIIIISMINTFLPYIIKSTISLAEKNFSFDSIKTKLFLLVILYIVSALICGIFEYLKAFLLAKNTQSLIYDIRKETYNRIMSFNMETFSNMHIGTLVTRMTSDISNVGEFIGKSLPMFVSSGIFLLTIIIVMCFINIYFAIVMIICSTLLVLSILKIGKKMAYYKNIEINNKEKITSYFSETFSSIKTLHIFNIQKERKEIFDKYNIDELESSTKYFDYQSLLTPIKTTTRYFIIFIILYLCLKGKIAIVDIGIIYLVVSYLDKFFEPLGNMLYHYEDLQKGKISMKRIDELIGNKNNAENIYQGEKAEKLYGNIKFINVNFSYVKGIKILDNINFSINKGEKIALVGKTGAGKTTIINLILGFYKINSGNIMFDNKNLDDISLESIRKNISFIQQNPYVFEDTVKKNIIVNNENNISDDQIIEILKQTGLYKKISTFKNGIYEKISSKSFSKGEVQLLSFARAIAKETSIYIFDEPTSNIDIESEKNIKQLIDNLSINSTIIIIAHKSSTIKNVDRVFKVTNKKVIIENN
ncbi:MAG: ABC transporter ATP-binding protein [Bacilli bacterium]|nr:ABC transporter ATP-binding protein [Bacilli bacterium]